MEPIVVKVKELVKVDSTMNGSEETESSAGAGPRHTSEKLRGPNTPEPSCVSMRTARSKSEPIEFRGEQQNPKLSPLNQDGPEPPEPSGASARSHRSRIQRASSDGRSAEPSSQVPGNPPAQDLDSIFTVLEENMVKFVKKELKRLRKILDSEHPEKEPQEDEDVAEDDGDGRRNSSQEAVLNVTLNYLRAMQQEQLAESLHSKSLLATCQRKLKSSLRRRFGTLFEGIAQAGNPASLEKVYTELHVTEGEDPALDSRRDVRRLQAASPDQKSIRPEDLLTPLPGRQQPVRTLLTKGVAGIGKTVLTQKFALDWAEDRARPDVDFVFPIAFRELNLLTGQRLSLVELLHHFFIETKEAGICRLEQLQVLFIFDGLDESQLDLDFQTNEILTDVTKSSSVAVLLTNLLRGKLLPSAQLWITTRPPAANQIPAACVDMVTEVKGFSDPQKDEYFRKRLPDEEQADSILCHIKTSRSLRVMCHIPVFCWITATVLEHVLDTGETTELPKTLTEMYIHFLVVQTKQGNVKYRGGAEADPAWISESKKTVRALGKLAFETLNNKKLIFYEDDLKDCGLDMKAASVYSGLITEVLRGKRGLNEDRAFGFVHLSIHEFLAALHVFRTFVETGVDLLGGKQLSLQLKSSLKRFYQSAVDRALESQSGHLDLFVRFLLGLSLENNQTLLRGLLKNTGSNTKVNEKLVQYIKKKIRGCLPPDRSINMFHCLNELNDHSLVEELQQYLSSGGVLAKRLAPSQWTALVFILLSSQKDLDVFDLRKFSASEDGLQSLLPVVSASTKSLLSGCDLSLTSCDALATVLSNKDSNLRELDLSNNDLGDTGATLLSAGLGCPHCKLEVLRLSGCQLAEGGCAALLLALDANPSHLRELDLSFNHPGDSSTQQLDARRRSPHWKLETLKYGLDHCGECRLKPVPQRYLCSLSMDPNTANRNLCLFQDNRGVMVVEESQPRPDHPDRFTSWKQLLCSAGLTGRCYWELHWLGRVNVGVAYRGIRRRGDGDDGCLGWNDQSWSLMCSPHSFTAWHNNAATDIDAARPSGCDRVAVHLDWPAGCVSFYCLPVSSNQPVHLHTFHAAFSEPVYPAFGFGRMLDLGTDPNLLPCSVVFSQVA